MHKDRVETAVDIASHLRALEAALDSTFMLANRLSISLIEGHRRTRISPTVGSPVYSLVGDVVHGLSRVRADVVAAHNALADVRDYIGVPARATGDLPKILEPELKPSGSIVSFVKPGSGREPTQAA